jgi:MFS family permease
MLTNLTHRLHSILASRPRQYWLLMLGMLINTTGAGFIWPFLNVYLNQELGIPLTLATMLPLLEQSISIFSTLGAGWFADRFGRKLLMALSLGATCLVYLGMAFAREWWIFAVLIGLRGLFLPLYRVAADAMVADLIPDEQERLPAYSLLRTANNIGWAIGPVLGGIVAAISYQLSFMSAASAMLTYALIVALGMHETLPAVRRRADAPAGAAIHPEPAGGYQRVFRDAIFLVALLAFAFNGMGAGLPFQLLGLYSKQVFQISEAQTGLVIMVNALMVVFLQVPVSRAVRRFDPLKVLAVGALFYAIGITSFAYGAQILQFAASMAVLTFGELLIAPTFTSFAVNRAPENLRGRYMGVYWIGWSFSRGIGPALAGRVYDNIGPGAIWYMGGAWNLLSALIFAALALYQKVRTPTIQDSSS